jgi:hypothetical protein
MSGYNSTEIGTIFRRPITRDINKVVKVEQEDERVVAQELEEYILTAGLERNFTFGSLDSLGRGRATS